MIIRVTTAGTYTRGAPGCLALGPGCMELARGTHAWGDAGGLGTMPDTLVGVRKAPACAFVTFSGGRGKGRGLRLLAVVDSADGLDPVVCDLPPEGDVALSPALDGTVTLGLHLRDLPAVAPTGDAADLARLTRLADQMRGSVSGSW